MIVICLVSLIGAPFELIKISFYSWDEEKVLYLFFIAYVKKDFTLYIKDAKNILEEYMPTLR